MRNMPHTGSFKSRLGVQAYEGLWQCVTTCLVTETDFGKSSLNSLDWLGTQQANGSIPVQEASVPAVA